MQREVEVQMYGTIRVESDHEEVRLFVEPDDLTTNDEIAAADKGWLLYNEEAESLAKAIEDVRNGVEEKVSPAEPVYVFPAQREPLLQAFIDAEQPVTIKYRNLVGDITTRVFSPYEITTSAAGNKFVKGRQAEAPGDPGFRQFSLSRVLGIAPSTEEFIPPQEDN